MIQSGEWNFNERDVFITYTYTDGKGRERGWEAARYRGPYILQIEYRLLCVKYERGVPCCAHMASRRVVCIPNVSLSVNASLSVNNREAARQILRFRSTENAVNADVARRESLRGMIPDPHSASIQFRAIAADFHPRSTIDLPPFDFHLFQKTCSRKHLVRHLPVTRRREKKKGIATGSMRNVEPVSSVNAIRSFA